MTPFSCVLTGDESLLIGCGDTLLDRGHDIRAIVSGNRDILDWAAAKGLPALKDIAALESQLTRGEFDWLFSIANLKVIPDSVLALPVQGAINFHDGPLPRYAGLNAPVWALMAGETRYGVTWHMLEGGIDEGDIVEQRLFDVAKDETAFSLNSKCYGAAMDSFAAVLDQLDSGVPHRQAQDLSQRSYFARAKRPQAAGRLDFTRDAESLATQVRALDFGAYWNPLLTANIALGDQVVLVGHAEPILGKTGVFPGTVLACDPDGLTVATANGALRLTGLTSPTKQAVDPVSLIATGQVLVSPVGGAADHLTACIQHCLKGEAHWRKALQDLQPVTVPLAVPRDKGADWTSYDMVLPDGLTGSKALAALMAWALHSSGADVADLAFSTADMAQAAQSAPGYVSDWVPLRIRRDETLAETMSRLTQDVARIDRVGGFASDLVARDPQITRTETPDIAITQGHPSPIPGTCITVSQSDPQTVTIHIDRDRLSDSTTALLANRLETLAQVISEECSSALTIGDLPTMPADERHQVLTGWNRTAHDYDRSLTIHHAFEAQAARTPNATALVFEATELTYAALNTQANNVAAKLVDLGVGPGSHVGLYVQRSADVMIGALAILKAGGAYVPLDPAYPADRIAHYLTDSAADVVITQPGLRQELPATQAQILTLDNTTTDKTTATATATANVDGGATADDLAYLIYTSGSTGTPKGVMVEHRNVANFFAGMDDRIDHAQGGVWLAVTSLAFDISVLELFWTLARGFKVVLTSDETRAVVSNGPLPISDRHLDFNLFYWGNDDGPGPRKYELLLEGARFADANGFNAVWTPERHFHAFGGPYPNPAVTGAAVAAVTKNLSVRAGSCVAPLHHPARIAEDWAVIDNLTNGRAALGIAAGWQPDDFVLRPENTPPNNKPAMYQTIETLRRLWRGEAVEFPTQDGGTHAVITQPRPVSKELPIWVTTAGNPETWKEAGQIGANVLTHLLGQTIDEVGGKIKLYHAALREAGHDPADFTVTVMLHTFLSDSRETAAEIARGPMKDYLRSAAGLIKQFAWVFPAFKRPKGVNNPFEMDLGTLTDDELEAILDFAFERYFEDAGLFGTVQDGLARAEQLKRIGVDEIACLIDYGIAPDQVMAGLKPLAEVLQRTNQAGSLADDDFSIAAQLVRHKVTHLQCTPSMARMIAMNDEARLALGRVQHLMLGGEALPGDLAADLATCSGAAIQNMYGPTETTIWSTSHSLITPEPGITSIGTPIANTSVYVLDPAGNPAPIGVPGELFIGGDGVTRGYWQRPDMTALRFLPDPFAAKTGLGNALEPRMYRTGDLVRWRADGQLDFLGRTDHQVKIRGQRIELGEIEAVLRKVSEISAAVVVPREFGEGDMRLVGYVTTSAPVSQATLKAHLAVSLPQAMVPAHIVVLDAMPLTPNKKIDRAALPTPTPDRVALPTQAAAQPGAGLEADIAAIWTRILGVHDIQADDNFFALGGHSLLAVQAHRELREALKLPKLSITDIFRFPTLAGLAKHLSPDSTPEPTAPAAMHEDRADTMSRRRAMRAGRAGRQAKTG